MGLQAEHIHVHRRANASEEQGASIVAPAAAACSAPPVAGMPDHVLNLIAAERDAKSQRVTGFLVYDSSSPTTARASSSWTVATLEDALAEPREIVEMCKVAIGVSDKTPLVNASARGRAIR